MGNANGQYFAHLHFEMREFITPFIGPGYRDDTRGWIDPSDFIASIAVRRTTISAGHRCKESLQGAAVSKPPKLIGRRSGERRSLKAAGVSAAAGITR